MAKITGRNYLIEFIKQSAHGSMKGLVKFLMTTFPTVKDHGALVSMGMTLLGPAISAWLEARGEVKSDIPGIVAEIAAELPREIKQEFDAAMKEEQGGATGTQATTTATATVLPRVWVHMDHANIAYHPDCGVKHHLTVVTEPAGKGSGQPKRKEVVRDGHHQIEFETFVLSGARACETEEEGWLEGCACVALFARDKALYVASKKAASGTVSAPKAGAAVVPSFAHFLGLLSKSNPEKAQALRALLVDLSQDEREDLEECDTEAEFSAIVACTSRVQLVAVAKTLRSRSQRTLMGDAGRLAAGWVRSVREHVAGAEVNSADAGARDRLRRHALRLGRTYHRNSAELEDIISSAAHQIDAELDERTRERLAIETVEGELRAQAEVNRTNQPPPAPAPQQRSWLGRLLDDAFGM